MSSSIAIASLGFGLGFMHALDADHIMAVSALQNKKPNIIKQLKFCFNWAVGHAGVLLVSGALLFGLGIHLPESLQQAAEMLVGVILIALGLLFYWQLRVKKLHIAHHSHRHVTHTHWHIAGDVNPYGHSSEKNSSYKNRKGHYPFLVGITHGLAGSAPVLALIPTTAQENPVYVVVYLFVFAIAMMLSMLFFGLGFGTCQRYLQKRNSMVFSLQRYLVAIASVVLGSVWLFQAAV